MILDALPRNMNGLIMAFWMFERRMTSRFAFSALIEFILIGLTVVSGCIELLEHNLCEVANLQH